MMSESSDSDAVEEESTDEKEFSEEEESNDDEMDREFHTAVHEAASGEDLALLEQALASSGELIDAEDHHHFSRTPLFLAAQKGRSAAIELLVRLGSKAIDTPCCGWTPLYAAAFHGHVSVIETLVRLGSKAIDTPDNYGWTPLYAATAAGHVSVIETLVRLGSKAVDSPNKSRWTPLFVAAANGNANVIEALVGLGSKVIDTPCCGETPLYAAAWNGHASVIESLVRLGSNAINTPALFNQTPLEAASKVSLPCMHVLWALGAKGSTTLSRPTEDEVAEIRFRVYFAQPLVHRLLYIPVARGSSRKPLKKVDPRWALPY